MRQGGRIVGVAAIIAVAAPPSRRIASQSPGVGHVIVDAAYDADHLRAFIADELGAEAHIKRNPTRREDRPIDWTLHKERHLVDLASGMLYRARNVVERMFCRLKDFRRIATCYDKRADLFLPAVFLAATVVW